jgi:Transposase IS4
MLDRSGYGALFNYSSIENTTEKGECYRRTAGGITLLERPKVIEEYNQFMGGFDLSDQIFYSNSMIIGQYRWWLKFFFYALDVGTSNALALYKNKEHNCYIMEFKNKLVKTFTGTRMVDVARLPINVHKVERTTDGY